jgi:hypothetical protein
MLRARGKGGSARRAQVRCVSGRTSRYPGVAGYIQETFEGFGPKQSRNLLQALGLTRYEIPIDIR